MRAALMMLLVAACELEPPPKQAPAPPPPPPAPVQPTGSGSGGSAAPAPMAVSDACLEAGAHFAEALIKNANDDTQKHLYEQLRTQTVRRTAEACTSQHWSDAAVHCYTEAITADQINACQKLLPAPEPGKT